MEMQPIFTTKDQVDAWFEQTVEGMSRAMATEAYYSRKSQASGEYHLLLTALNRTRERLYTSLRISEKPSSRTVEELVSNSLILQSPPQRTN